MKIIAVTILSGIIAASSAAAVEFEVGQKNKQFTTRNLSIKVGDTVKFSNQDPFFHNVFSSSTIKAFDLGSFPIGNARNVTFDKPGLVEVECSMHPEMYLTVEVE